MHFYPGSGMVADLHFCFKFTGKISNQPQSERLAVLLQFGFGDPPAIVFYSQNKLVWMVPQGYINFSFRLCSKGMFKRIAE